MFHDKSQNINAVLAAPLAGIVRIHLWPIFEQGFMAVQQIFVETEREGGGRGEREISLHMRTKPQIISFIILAIMI